MDNTLQIQWTHVTESKDILDWTMHLAAGLVKSETVEYLSVNFQSAEERIILNQINRLTDPTLAWLWRIRTGKRYRESVNGLYFPWISYW